MRVTTITVSSSRKLPNPNVDYASVSGLVSLTAELAEGENSTTCAVRLQDEADALVEAHMAAIAAKMQMRERVQREQQQAAKAQAATGATASKLAEKFGGTHARS